MPPLPPRALLLPPPLAATLASPPAPGPLPPRPATHSSLDGGGGSIFTLVSKSSPHVPTTLSLSLATLSLTLAPSLASPAPPASLARPGALSSSLTMVATLRASNIWRTPE